jgi:hypothetical protein
VIDTSPISTISALTGKYEIPRKFKGETGYHPSVARPPKLDRKTHPKKKAQKRKKPAAGGGAAGFKLDRRLGGGVPPIHIERHWEEECVASMI